MAHVFNMSDPEPERSSRLSAYTDAFRVIGLAGFKRSGKDTIGAELVRRHGFARFAFAAALRAEVRELDGIADPGDRHKDQRGPDGRSYRDALIARGQMRRAQDPDYWVKALDRAVAASGAQRVVVTDIRFPNEIDWVQDRGGVVVWIRRPGVVSDGGVSEQDWSGACDDIMENVNPYDPAWIADTCVLMANAFVRAEMEMAEAAQIGMSGVPARQGLKRPCAGGLPDRASWRAGGAR